MSLFLSAAAALAQTPAASRPPSGPAGILASPLVMMAVIFAIIYLLIMRPQQKKQKQHQEMLRTLQRGDRVVTQSGIYGTIANLDEKHISLQVDERVRLKIGRWSVADKVTEEIGV